MVFLAYYHNDIPSPDYSKCDSGDKELLTGKGKFTNLFRKTALYRFINFRTNRLLEKLKMKPTMADCINANYSSFSWEMEKGRLSRAFNNAAKKNASFTITPNLYKGLAPKTIRELERKKGVWRKNSKLERCRKNKRRRKN